MRIFYYLSDYISHRIAGLDYIECLKSLGHEVSLNSCTVTKQNSLTPAEIEQAKQADLFILHEEPMLYNNIYAMLPFLEQKRVAAYVVWENEKLARQYVKPLQFPAVIWTCSDFSCAAIAGHVKSVQVLPHVVRRVSPGVDAMGWYHGVLQQYGASGAFIFFSVIDALNPRKNMYGLLTAFSLLQKQWRGNARLLLKQYRTNVSCENLPGVINISGTLSQEQMAALYASCGAYVSAHHAEGWGLGISSAMAYGKPVIATGYSGNMQFMTPENSFPVPYSMVPVSDEMCRKLPLFTPDMQWADIDTNAMSLSMRQVAEGRCEPGLQKNASAITSRFGIQQVSARLAELLDSALQIKI